MAEICWMFDVDQNNLLVLRIYFEYLKKEATKKGQIVIVDTFIPKFRIFFFTLNLCFNLSQFSTKDKYLWI